MIKKNLSALTALMLAVSFSAVSASAEYAKGDVDGSGNIDIEDVANLMNHINGVKAMSGDSLAAADINSDESVDIVDVVSIINTINGIAQTITKPDPDDLNVVNTYYRDLFSVSVNGNWKIEEGPYSNTVLTYIGDDIPNAKEACSILINAKTIEGLEAESLVDIAPMFIDGMGLGSALKINSESFTTFNGYDAYIADGVYTSKNNVDFFVTIIVVKQEATLLVIEPMIYIAADNAIGDEMRPILDSIRLN